MAEARQPLRIAALVSGRGSNLQAIVDAIAAGQLSAEISVVISNIAKAPALERAASQDIPTQVIRHRDFPDREAFDAELARCIDAHKAELVVLAGFMRLLTPTFVQRFSGRLVNIHPSLLPAFPGLHPHERALEAGVRIHGATVHFVNEETDGGPIIAQAAIPVLANDTPETLAERVLAQEHRLYPMALQWISEGRLRLENGRVLVNGAESPPLPMIWPG